MSLGQGALNSQIQNSIISQISSKRDFIQLANILERDVKLNVALQTCMHMKMGRSDRMASGGCQLGTIPQDS